MKTCLILLLWAHVALAYKSYEGHKVFKILAKDDNQLTFLREATLSPDHYDIGREAIRPGQYTEVLVDPSQLDTFTMLLDNEGFEYTIPVHNMADVMKAELKGREGDDPVPAHVYSVYHTLDEINTWIDEIKANYTNAVELFDIGQSYEGRTIRGLKVTTGGAGKPAIWIDSAIHCREWIAPATTVYMIGKLLADYANNDPDAVDIVNNLDIYLIPILNPDGYEYTWNGERQWRKTRSPNAGSSCIGTDANRNFDYFFCTVGASTNPCMNTYCGAYPLSEIESENLVNYLETIPNLQAYFAYHSSGQYYMTPWAYEHNEPADHAQAMAACNQAIDALHTTNNFEAVFQCGTVASFVGRTSGSTVDWIKVNLGPTYALGVELRDKGETIFELPPEQIIPSGEENYSAVMEYFKIIRSENRGGK